MNKLKPLLFWLSILLASSALAQQAHYHYHMSVYLKMEAAK